MPFYHYHCHHCRRDFTVKHGMFFEQSRCTLCHTSGFLEKIVPQVSIKKQNFQENKKVGDITKEHIEDAREDLKKMKKERKEKEL